MVQVVAEFPVDDIARFPGPQFASGSTYWKRLRVATEVDDVVDAPAGAPFGWAQPGRRSSRMAVRRGTARSKPPCLLDAAIRKILSLTNPFHFRRRSVAHNSAVPERVREGGHRIPFGCEGSERKT